MVGDRKGRKISKQSDDTKMSFQFMYDKKSFTPHVQFVMCQIFNVSVPKIIEAKQYSPEIAIFINKNSIASDMSKVRYTLRTLHRTAKDDPSRMIWLHTGDTGD